MPLGFQYQVCFWLLVRVNIRYHVRGSMLVNYFFLLPPSTIAHVCGAVKKGRISNEMKWMQILILIFFTRWSQTIFKFLTLQVKEHLRLRSGASHVVAVDKVLGTKYIDWLLFYLVDLIKRPREGNRREATVRAEQFERQEENEGTSKSQEWLDGVFTE